MVQITEDSVKQHGEELGSVVSNAIRKCLSEELKNLVVSISLSSMTLISIIMT